MTDKLTEIVSARFTTAERTALGRLAEGRPVAQVAREIVVEALHGTVDEQLFHWHGHGYCVMAAPGRSIAVSGGSCCRPGRHPAGPTGTAAGVRALAAALLRAAEIAEQPEPQEADR